MAGNYQSDSSVSVITRVKVPTIAKYSVIMFNDDVTTFDFVIRILMEIFEKDEVTATTLAYKIDQEGSCIIGSYTREIAETYVEETIQQARSEGFPLVCEILE